MPVHKKKNKNSVPESERSAHVVSVRLNPEARAALDRTADTWGLSRSATVARLAMEQDQRNAAVARTMMGQNNAPRLPESQMMMAATLVASVGISIEQGKDPSTDLAAANRFCADLERDYLTPTAHPHDTEDVSVILDFLHELNEKHLKRLTSYTDTTANPERAA